MSESSQWHYTDKTGQQAGPVSTAELLSLVSSQAIDTTAMAWKEGMAGWQPLSQIEELNTAQFKQTSEKPDVVTTPPPATLDAPTPEPAPQTIDPYEAPSTSLEDDDAYGLNQANGYGGIGRLAYFLISILVGVITQGVTMALGGEQIEPNISYMILAGSVIFSMFLAFARLKNIGMSRWWYLANFVPILNIFISVWIMSRQEGWVETRQLDTAGKVIAWIMWTIFILAILAVVAAIIFISTAALG